MKTTAELIKLVENGEFFSVFSSLYGEEKAESSKDRYLRLLVKFSERFSEERECAFFSAPGRSEIIGNHTDHQHGCAIAQAVDLDTVAVASKNDENVIRIHSLGYSPDEVDITDTEPKSSEFGTSKGIIRGVAAAFKRMGYTIGGFDAVTHSLVPGGSGLSSSAAFEVLLSKILNVFYNEDKASPKEQAIIGKTAENEFFGKPSGLLDQMASSAGGLNFIDFSDPEDPLITPIDFDFNDGDYGLYIVKTGGSHADLTDDYAAIPREMCAVASMCGKQFMRDVDLGVLMDKMPDIRKKYGDRAVIRALNFIDENERVLSAKAALSAGDVQTFKRLVIRSGRGSYMYLQNVVSGHNTREQGLALALMVSERILRGSGSWRVHGGGFAGTILAFVPNDMSGEYSTFMESLFGQGSCIKIRARKYGGYCFG